MYVRSVDDPHEKVEVRLRLKHVSSYFEDDEDDVTFEEIQEAYSN